MHNTTRALYSATLHSNAWHSARTTKSLHRRLLRRVTTAWRSRLSIDLAWLCHVHRWTCVRACDVWACSTGVRARVRNMRATTIAELCMRRAGRLVLHLRLWALLLLGSLLQSHLLHLPLAHQLSVVLLVVGCIASRIHVGVLRQWSLLLLLLLLWHVLLLWLLCLVLCALLGATSISVGAVGDSPIGLVRGLIVVICRRIVVCGLLLLLRIADPSSGVHCILTHLARRLRLMLQLFRGKVGELDFGHLRIACSQLILNLYDCRNVTRGQLLRNACWRRRRWHAGRCRHLLLAICLSALGMRCSIRSLEVAMLLRRWLWRLLSLH
jgi:hypothetical protein